MVDSEVGVNGRWYAGGEVGARWVIQKGGCGGSGSGSGSGRACTVLHGRSAVVVLCPFRCLEYAVQ